MILDGIAGLKYILERKKTKLLKSPLDKEYNSNTGPFKLVK